MSTFNNSPSILFLSANPTDTSRLRLDLEFREVQEGLLRARSRVNLQQRWATRITDLRRALLEAQPELLHISAHGTPDKGLVFEDDRGYARPVEGEALAELFALFSPQLKCVVLNACYSALQARAIADHVDYVIGMDSAIPDDAAIAFSVAFYDGVAAGKSMEFAFTIGRNAVALEGLGDANSIVLLKKPPDAVCDWGHAPDVPALFGREEELRTLDRWLHRDRVRLILILGFGGVGKTGLSLRFGQGGVGKTDLVLQYARQTQALFQMVIWRSLVSAPSLHELMDDLYVALQGLESPMRVSRDEFTVNMLLDVLRERRILLILDNYESVLDHATESGYRAGYSPYAALIDSLGRLEHDSTLILTSREKPPGLERLEGRDRPVRTLLLGGLDAYNGRRVFEAIGEFQGTEDEWRRIVDFYDGNPLALELAARHILAVYGGDISAFLEETAPVVEDIESLLDWHVTRLPSEELEVLIWLAIDREPVSVAELREDVLSSESRRSLPQTIQSLQRHLPLEREHLRIGLQPVLLEYLTRRLVEGIGDEFRLHPTWIADILASEFADEVGEELNGKSPGPLLRSFALTKATSKSAIRRAQRRLILVPILDRVKNDGRLGSDLRESLFAYLDQLRGTPPDRSYAAGNIITLLIEMGERLDRADLSNLLIRQVNFQNVVLQDVSLAQSELRQVRFRSGFAHLLCLAISDDGRLLAAGDTAGNVHVWTVENDEPWGVLEGHNGWVRCLAFSPDSEYLSSGSEDTTIKVWSLSDGLCEATLLGNRHWVNDLVFDASGKHIVSAGEDGTTRVWDWRTKRCIKELTLGPARVRAVRVISHGAEIVVATEEGRLLVWNLATGQCQQQVQAHEDWIAAIDVSRTEPLLATAGFDSAACLWSLEDRERLQVLRGHQDWLWDVAFSNDGRLLATASRDRCIRVWNVRQGRCERLIEKSHEGTVRAVAFYPNNDRLVSVGQDQALRTWEVHDGKEIGVLLGYANAIWSLATSGRKVVSGGDDAILRLWDTETRECEAQFTGHRARVWCVAFRAPLIASGSSDRTVRVWNIVSGDEVCRIRAHDDWVLALSIDSRGELLVTASSNWDPVVKLWDLNTGQLLCSFTGHTDRIHAVSFGEDSDFIVSSSDDGTVRGWSYREASELFCHNTGFKGVRGKRSPFAMSPEGGPIAFAGDDGLVLWDLESRRAIQTIAPQRGQVTAVAFTDSGRALCLATSTGRIEIWDVGADSPSDVLQSNRPSYQAICHCEEDGVVVAATSRGEIDLWEGGRQSGTMIAPRPYEGLLVKGTKGITRGQRAILHALGAVE